MTPLRESVLAAAADVLRQAIPDVTVDRARRAPPALEEFPRLVLRGLNAQPDQSQSPSETFWIFDFEVSGYVRSTTDLGAEQALSELHARVMAALENADLGPGAVQPTVGVAEMALFDAETSSVPAGQFAVIFQALSIAPTASPYAP